jgi:hypothetical protein
VDVWPAVKINLKGFSANVLVKSEFDKWRDHQIELLKMLDDIRTRLKRDGMLSSQGLSGFIAEKEQDLTTSSNGAEMDLQHDS